MYNITNSSLAELWAVNLNSKLIYYQTGFQKEQTVLGFNKLSFKLMKYI